MDSSEIEEAGERRSGFAMLERQEATLTFGRNLAIAVKAGAMKEYLEMAVENPEEK